MGEASAIQTKQIPVYGWLVILLRLTLILVLLLVCVPFYYLWRLLRLPRFWPRVFLGGVGLIAGLRITIRGQAHRHALLISNHVSWLDIPAIAWATGSAFVGHSGLASVTLLRHLCAMNDTVFIARHDRASVAKQIEQVREAIADTGALTIFPEGTTSDGTGLLPFKSALLSAADPLPEGTAVQPVLLDYNEAPGIAWVGEEHGVDNFKRILARLRPVRLTVHFLPALEGSQLASRKEMALAAQKAIATAMASAR
jgi:1-acyl-sn-glycerol-3-phosphate acyltransferase